MSVDLNFLNQNNQETGIVYTPFFLFIELEEVKFKGAKVKSTWHTNLYLPKKPSYWVFL